ncbi:hypothetical protein ACFQVD_42070 [Streptosporangium amethystogenes subsp. fukuiense]|uniref:Vegetative cell wall protein gp1 n=1 Tax=Streptosporangium amethystogenes subsp. fukuiense TaxID=698418 RepID=A0ABW2TEC1_9ACTN
MTVFLAELGKKLAERWLTLLVLPGLVYLTCAVVAATLRHGRALDVAALRDTANRIAAQPASASPGAVLLAAAGILAAAAAAALTAAALGQAVERVWTTPGRNPLARRLTERRRKRWDEADARVRREITAAVRAGAGSAPQVSGAPAHEVGDAIGARNAIGLTRPQRPTWIGDRLYAADQRVHAAYDLDLDSAWPRLWLIMPEQTRAELTVARDNHTAAARLAGWAILYLPLGWWWWPAIPVTVAIALTARVRARQAAAVLADLVEATVDLYGRDLAVQLGISHDGPLTRQTGLAITGTLRKDLESLPAVPATSVEQRAVPEVRDRDTS